MKIKNISNIKDFLEVVDKCRGKVELISPEGDRLNLKSKLTKYVALSELLGASSSLNVADLDIVAYDSKDVARLLEFIVAS